jgi:hypothetical protein
VPRLCEFYPGICLTIEEKARENLSQGKKNLSQVKKNFNHSTVYILPKTPTHYKAFTNREREREREVGIKSWEHGEGDVSSYRMTLTKRDDTGN